MHHDHTHMVSAIVVDMKNSSDWQSHNISPPPIHHRAAHIFGEALTHLLALCTSSTLEWRRGEGEGRSESPPKSHG